MARVGGCFDDLWYKNFSGTLSLLQGHSALFLFFVKWLLVYKNKKMDLRLCCVEDKLTLFKVNTHSCYWLHVISLIDQWQKDTQAQQYIDKGKVEEDCYLDANVIGFKTFFKCLWKCLQYLLHHFCL